MSFFGELKRRNVFRVGAAYAVVSWLLIQIGDVVFPTFNAPPWVLQIFIVVLVLGFPVALILSWVYELTSQGLKKTEDVQPAESITGLTGKRLDRTIIVVLALAVVVLVIDNYVLDDRSQSVAPVTPATALDMPQNSGAALQQDVIPDSIAVLPLDDLSPNPENAFFALGIHAEIVTQLQKIRNLTVISRDSVMVYAEDRPSLADIARELRVESLLTGSFQYSNGNIRLVVSLVDPHSGRIIWAGEPYQAPFADIFEVQADIAMNVANGLAVEFSDDEQQSIERVLTSSPEAHELYLEVISSENITDQALHALLDRAIRLDPNFARAYARKAMVYSGGLINTAGSPGAGTQARLEIERQVRDNVEIALSLDPTLSEAHAALGVLAVFSWRWGDALEAFRRANPGAESESTLHAWVSAYMGRRDEAIRIGQQLIEYSPTLFLSYRNNGMVLGYLKDYDASMQSLQRAFQLNPRDLVTNTWIATIQAAQGRNSEAIEQLRFTEQAMGAIRPIVLLPEIAHAYARVGEADAALRIFEEVRQVEANGFDLGAGSWAQLYLAINETGEALEWLEIAADKAQRREIDTGFYNLMIIRLNVLNDPILERPEFLAIRERLTGI